MVDYVPFASALEGLPQWVLGKGMRVATLKMALGELCRPMPALLTVRTHWG